MRYLSHVPVEVTSHILDLWNKFVPGGAFGEDLGGLSNEVVQFVGLGHRGGLPTDSSRGEGAPPRRRMTLGSELSLESFQERGPCGGGVGGPRWFLHDIRGPIW
jgi:hypothetical protein